MNDINNLITNEYCSYVAHVTNTSVVHVYNDVIF